MWGDRSRIGQASVLGVLTIILISVGIGAIVLLWGMSAVGRAQLGFSAPLTSDVQKASEDLIIENVVFTQGNVTVFVRNIGSVELTVDHAYVNHEFRPLIDNSYTEPEDNYALTLEPREAGAISISYEWEAEETYHLTLATRRGNTFETYVRAPSTST